MTDATQIEAEEGGLAGRRGLLGMSAALWSRHGDHLVEAGWWKAISGVPLVDYNLVVCHGPDPELVVRGLEAIAAAKCPAVLALAGPGLAHAQSLSDQGWVCIGAAPIMVRHQADAPNVDIDTDLEVKRATAADLPRVWDTVCATYRVDQESARVTLPADMLDVASQNVWILGIDGEVRSCVATVEVGGALIGWTMATHPDWQQRGYGRRLLTAALDDAARHGVTESLVLASPAGEPMYRSMDYHVMEHWQMWSRPRWVLGRA